MTRARDLSKLLGTANNGVIPNSNLGVSFENISDSGTAGTKVASGTTGQRGSTAGQIRFNTTTGLAEYYTGTEFKIIDSPPTVTAVSPLEVDSAAGGNITFTVTGTNFQSGAVTKFVGNDGTEITASTTTVTNSTTISAVIARSSFVGAKEPYDVKVINASGLLGILDNQINVDVSPAWSTASGNIANIADTATGTHATVSATDADGDTVSYSETGGTVLTTAGLTLNSSTGAISGDPTNVGSSTTYSFNLRATANSKTVDRAFNIIVTEDIGALSDAEFYINPSKSSSWSGSGSTIVNITPYASKSASTTNANLNGRSIVTSGGITYINNPVGDTPTTATIGNISGNLQNYTFIWFSKITSGDSGTTLRYGTSNVGQSIGSNESISSNYYNHYNYGNDSQFTATTSFSNWKMVTLRKTSGIKEAFNNATQLSAISTDNSATNLPANSTLEIGNRADYNYFSTQTGLVAVWSRSLTNSEISYIYNRFKGNYGL